MGCPACGPNGYLASGSITSASTTSCFDRKLRASSVGKSIRAIAAARALPHEAGPWPEEKASPCRSCRTGRILAPLALAERACFVDMWAQHDAPPLPALPCRPDGRRSHLLEFSSEDTFDLGDELSGAVEPTPAVLWRDRTCARECARTHRRLENRCHHRDVVNTGTKPGADTCLSLPSFSIPSLCGTG